MEQELRQILVEVCGVPADFDRSANLYMDLGVPSVKAMILLMVLEERYGFQVPDEQFVEAVSLEKLTALVEELQRTSA